MISTTRQRFQKTKQLPTTRRYRSHHVQKRNRRKSIQHNQQTTPRASLHKKQISKKTNRDICYSTFDLQNV